MRQIVDVDRPSPPVVNIERQKSVLPFFEDCKILFFKKWAIFVLFFFYFRQVTFKIYSLSKISPMIGFELQTSSARSNLSASSATTTAHWTHLEKYRLIKHLCLWTSWSFCSPSTLKIQFRIPTKSTVFLGKKCLKRTNVNKKRSGQTLLGNSRIFSSRQ